MSRNFPCPSCGAPLEIAHRFTRTVVCSYCRQTCTITPTGLDATTRGVELVGAPSIFSVGASGALHGDPFRVFGRLRYAYAGGFWDEWYLCLDHGGEIWLQEDDGAFTAFEKTPITHALPEFEAVSVGRSIRVNGRSMFVTERTRAVIQGAEGELRFAVAPGMDVDCVDGNIAGETVSIEYTPEEVTVSIGRSIPRAGLEFSRG